MKLDHTRFYTDESVSNPIAVAQRYPDCPINRPCFWVVAGPGAPAEVCEYLKDESTLEAPGAVCTYHEKIAGGA